IILASGGAMTYFSAMSGHVLFTVAITALTLAAVGFLFMRTFRHSNRHVVKASTASRLRKR
ncbi:MAG TPA: hypothetical protein VJN88_07670, partial [Ktedonobacterales bacterium]|nr:hypothetical protein [Ktedonobacterales bacterium]